MSRTGAGRDAHDLGELLALLDGFVLSGVWHGDDLLIRSSGGRWVGEARRCDDLWWLRLMDSGEWCAFSSPEEVVSRAGRAPGVRKARAESGP